MKTTLQAAGLAIVAAGLIHGAALADGPRPHSGTAIAQNTERQPPAARYEWRYHYVGHHPHLEGYWAPVN